MKIPEGAFGEWLCSREVALQLDVTIQAVHDLHYRGTLVGTMRGGQRWWRKSAVIALKESKGYQKRTRRPREIAEEMPEIPGLDLEKGAGNGK